jgi:hypothetical protein
LVLPVEEQESAIRFYGGCRSGVMVVTNLIMVRWRGKRKSSGVFTKLIIDCHINFASYIIDVNFNQLITMNFMSFSHFTIKILYSYSFF